MPLSDATNRSNIPTSMDGSSTEAKKLWSKQMAERLMSKKKFPNPRNSDDQAHDNIRAKRAQDDEFEQEQKAAAAPVALSPLRSESGKEERQRYRAGPSRAQHDDHPHGVAQLPPEKHSNRAFANNKPNGNLTHLSQGHQKWLGTIFTAVDPEMQQFVANTPHCSPPASPRDCMRSSACGSKLEITSSTQSAADSLSAPNMMRGSYGAHSLGEMLEIFLTMACMRLDRLLKGFLVTWSC
jgi:hypothetical protein